MLLGKITLPMITTFFLLRCYLLCFFSAALLPAQTGDWNPPNADTSRPRTLLHGRNIPATQQLLERPIFAELYRGVWLSAQSPIPTDNASSSGRRVRAGLAKNIAFVLLLDRMPSGSAFQPITPAMQATLADRVLQLLNDLNTDVPLLSVTTPTAYDDWQWRSKELIDMLCAYDLLMGARIQRDLLAAAQIRLQEFAANLHRESTKSILGLTFFGVIKNNHALMTAAALGAAAVVLNNATSSNPDAQPATWISTALWNCDNVLWRDAARQSEPGVVAGYAEGPHYFRYAFLNLLPFFRALGNFLPDTTLSVSFNGIQNSIRHPFHDPEYDQLYRWAASIRLPDGTLPPLDDTFLDEGFPELAIAGKPEFVWPITGGVPRLAAQLNSTVDMRANFIAAGIESTKPTLPPMAALPESGDLVLRSGWDSAATYLHISAEHGRAMTSGAGHNQADDGSFMLFSQGEHLALDPGYLKYDRRSEVGNAANHNMILVDGRGPAIGSPGLPGGANSYLRQSAFLPGLMYGLVETTYEGTTIQRHAFLLEGNQILLADVVRAATPHRFTWQLHGNGLAGGNSETGLFTEDFGSNMGRWQKNGVELLAYVTGRGDSVELQSGDGVHELRYDSAAHHTVMLATSNRTTATEFLAACIPQKTGASNLTLSSDAAADGATVLNVAAGSQRSLMLTAPDSTYREYPSSLTGAPGPIRTDAAVIVATTNALGMQRYLMCAGTEFQHGNRTLMSTFGNRMTMAVVRQPEAYYCYASDSGTVVVLPDEAATVRDVVGDGVAQWQYQWGSGNVVVRLSRGSTFVIQLDRQSGVSNEEAQPEGVKIIGSTGYLPLPTADRSGATITLLNLLGEVVRAEQATPTAGGYVLVDLSATPTGAYFAVLRQRGCVVGAKNFWWHGLGR